MATLEEHEECRRAIRECIVAGMTGWWVLFRPGEPPRAFPRYTELLRDPHSHHLDGAYLAVRVPAKLETVDHLLRRWPQD
jgi:hypothetical protein